MSEQWRRSELWLREISGRQQCALPFSNSEPRPTWDRLKPGKFTLYPSSQLSRNYIRYTDKIRLKRTWRSFALREKRSYKRPIQNGIQRLTKDNSIKFALTFWLLVVCGSWNSLFSFLLESNRVGPERWDWNNYSI